MPKSDEHGLELPPRTGGSSLEESLVAQTKDMAMSGVGAVMIFASWWDELKGRPFNIPSYEALNGTAAILVYFSTDALATTDLFKRLYLERRPWKWYVSAFLKGPRPVLRCSLSVPDDPAHPYLLESPLDICNGDVQEFCTAVVRSERLDLITTHEGLEKGECAAAGYRAPGIGARLRQEFNKASRALRPGASRDDLRASIDLLERVYPSASSGLDPGEAIRLEYAGEASNRDLTFAR